MTRAGHALRERVSDEAGFTLVELLVVLMAATVITGALFTMLDVTLHQTSRTYSKVSSSQSGRIAVDNIENELHSACVSSELAPVQANSDGNDLIFISQYGSAAFSSQYGSGASASSATPTPVEHKIVFDPNAGTLTDNTYAETGGGGDNWTFSSSPSTTTTMATGVTASGSTPVFQYFDYSEPLSGTTPYTDSAGNTYMMIQDGINYVPGTSVQPAAAPLSVPLSTTDAAVTTEVLINFVAGPSGGSMVNSNLGSVGTTVQDQVVLRLTTPDNHAGDGATFFPCE
jgi:hypothetical protein